MTVADESPKNLRAKLAAVMGAVERIPKNGYNSFHKYHFVREGDLVDAIRTELAKQRVFITCEVKDVEHVTGQTKSGGDKSRTYVSMVFTFLDADSDEKIQIPFHNEAEDTGDKGTNKAITAAKKYFLLTNFLVPTGDDLDQESPVERKPGAPAPKPPHSSGPSPVKPSPTGSRSETAASSSTANPPVSPVPVEQPKPASASHPTPGSPSKPADGKPVPVMCEVCGALVPSSRAKESQDQVGMVLCITDLKTALSNREAKK